MRRNTSKHANNEQTPVVPVGKREPRNAKATAESEVKLRLRDDQDDWDCLADLEAAGFVELVSYATGLVHIFPVGIKAAAALRDHGAGGRALIVLRISKCNQRSCQAIFEHKEFRLTIVLIVWYTASRFGCCRAQR